MTYSAPINHRWANNPIDDRKDSKMNGPSSNINIGKKRKADLKNAVLESCPMKDLTAMAPKQTLNFKQNLHHVELHSSAANHVTTMSNAFKAPRVKREAEPDKLHASIPKLTPLQTRKPHPRQELCLDFKGGPSCLVLAGCQQCHQYIMTLPDNEKCPSCKGTTLKELWKLEKEAADRNAAKRKKLNMGL